MGRRSKHGPQVEDGTPESIDSREFSLRIDSPRRYSGGDADGSTAGAAQSQLFERGLGGDWSWKPDRDKALGHRMRTFRGVPPGAAEMRPRDGYR